MLRAPSTADAADTTRSNSSPKNAPPSRLMPSNAALCARPQPKSDRSGMLPAPLVSGAGSSGEVGSWASSAVAASSFL